MDKTAISLGKSFDEALARLIKHVRLSDGGFGVFFGASDDYNSAVRAAKRTLGAQGVIVTALEASSLPSVLDQGVPSDFPPVGPDHPGAPLPFLFVRINGADSKSIGRTFTRADDLARYSAGAVLWVSDHVTWDALLRTRSVASTTACISAMATS